MHPAQLDSNKWVQGRLRVLLAVNLEFVSSSQSASARRRVEEDAVEYMYLQPTNRAGKSPFSAARPGRKITMKKKGQTVISPGALVVFACLLVFTSALFSSGGSAMAQGCVPASLAAGSLDTCFGGSGKVTTSLNNGTGSTSANDVAIQADGKIVIAAASRDFYVLRYNADGLIDSTFGSGGVARIAFTKNSDDENPQAIAIQSDGKIIVAGYAPIRGNIYAFAIARLNSNGSLDTSFGSSGKVLFNFQNNVSALARGVTIQTNGYIVVAGESKTSFALARLTPNGAFDLGFNGTGKVTVSTANSTSGAGGALDIAIQKVTVNNIIQEKVVVAGVRPSDVGDRDIAVLRFNPNGSLDSSFGSGGKVFTNFTGYSDQAKAIVIDANNNIVVAGHTLTDSTNGQMFALVRYTENGQLDASFGSGGKVIAGDPGYRNAFYGHGLAIQADGRIVASGFVELPLGAYADFAVARFNSDGTLDTTFGPDVTGIVLTDFYGDNDHAWGGMSLQADGRLVVVGGAYPLPQQIALARYMP